MREIPTRHGFKALIDDQTYALTADIILDEQNGWFEPEIDFIVKLAKQFSGTLIDIGANVGVYSMAWCANGGEFATAFEPNPRLIERLRLNAQANDANVEIFECALASHSGRTRFKAQDTLGHISSDGDIEVDLATLDHALATRTITGPVVIKLDAEGAEVDILQGAKEFVEQQAPLILFERSVETATHLSALGLSLFRLLPGPLVLIPDDGRHDMVNGFAIGPAWTDKLRGYGLIAESDPGSGENVETASLETIQDILHSGKDSLNDPVALGTAYRAGLSLLAREPRVPDMLAFSRIALAMGFREQAFTAAKAALTYCSDGESKLQTLMAIENSRSWSIAFDRAWTLPLLSELAENQPKNEWLRTRLGQMRRLIELGRIAAP
jgi:FkbM family methyltransferase